MMKKIFAANWKLFKTPTQARDFFSEFLKHVNKIQGEVIFFPQAFSLEAVSHSIGHSKVGFGPQNIWIENEGAFTGENSAKTAKSLNSTHALVGHSERRKIFGESDEQLSLKLKLVQAENMIPVYCIGETLEAREAGQTNQVNQRQLELGLQGIDKSKKIVVAYEPVWAIGTGKVATPDQVKEAHAFIRQTLDQMGLKDTPILYGGSVKPDNAASLLSIPHVDGFLVGGESLEVKSFLGICQVSI